MLWFSLQVIIISRTHGITQSYKEKKKKYNEKDWRMSKKIKQVSKNVIEME